MYNNWILDSTNLPATALLLVIMNMSSRDMTLTLFFPMTRTQSLQIPVRLFLLQHMRELPQLPTRYLREPTGLLREPVSLTLMIFLLLQILLIMT